MNDWASSMDTDEGSRDLRDLISSSIIIKKKKHIFLLPFRS